MATRTRAEGQWALGYREPLNAAEQAKREDDGLNVRARIEEVYARKGFSAIWPSDLRNRFRWYGLYTQRPEADGYFMMRVRVPGGQLTADQADALAEVAQGFGRDVADITDRQNIQFHWIRIEDVPKIWERLEAVGLTTTESCGDTPRNILGCPLAGVDASEILDASGAVAAVSARLVNDPAFSNLPRKYKISISGCAHACGQHEINDVGLVGAIAPDGFRGYDLWVGGGLSTTPMFGQRLNAFVRPHEVEEVVVGVTEVFRDWGYRRSRNRARLKFLMRDWGATKFREVLENHLGHRLEDLEQPVESREVGREHLGVWAQSDGRFYVGFAPRAGRVSGHQLSAIARLARRFGDGRIRTTTQQKMVVLGIERENVDALVDELEALDLPVRASTWRAGTMACTGIEFCKLAIVETKGRAVELYRYLEREVPELDEPLRINVNGCPNSCARYQTADIGLMGCQVSQRVWTTDAAGAQVQELRKVEAFLVHLGGHLGQDRAFGRKVKGLRVLSNELGPYVVELVRRYLKARRSDDTFAAFVHRLSDAELSSFAEKPAFHGLPPPSAIVAEPRSG